MVRRSRRFGVFAAFFAAFLAFVSVTHAAAHLPASGDAVPCGVCDSPSDVVTPAVSLDSLDEAFDACDETLAHAPDFGRVERPAARGPPRS